MSWLRAEFLGRDLENVIPGTDGHEMTGAVHRVPDGSRHLVGHRLVDGVRHQLVVQSLPHMDTPFDGRDVESPTTIEEFGIANQTVTAVREAFGERIEERGFDVRSKQDLAVVVVDGV